MIRIESLASNIALHQALYEAIHNVPLPRSVSYLAAAMRHKLWRELNRRHCVNRDRLSEFDFRGSGILKAAPIQEVDGMVRAMNEEIDFLSDGPVK